MTNRLYYGDNLPVMRTHIASASIDLVYLDPPFNSKRDYNLLFKAPRTLPKKNKPSADSLAAIQQEDFSAAQITAFEDTWHWGEQAESEFRELQRQSNTDVAELMQALRSFLRENDMMAYLTMMANRLLELHRVLKPQGSLYLHCDPTASHYLKIVLDAVFGKQSFRSEVIWKRTSAHSSAKRWGPVHDTLLFYAKGDQHVWNAVFESYTPDYIDKNFSNLDADGRRWKSSDITGSGVRRGETGLVWRGLDVTAKNRHWAYPPTELEKMDAQGRIHWPKVAGGMPRFKNYLDEMDGIAAQDVIADIQPLSAHSAERLGYPTQKPLALLERIIAASSNPGDVILDPFCGCGTAVHAAQRLGRRWVGIDITHLSISLIEKRMRSAFADLRNQGAFLTVGVPQDIGSARRLAEDDKYQFQFWALSLVGAQPFRGGKKGADGGIDGLIFPEVGKGKTEKIIVSVKGGDNVGLTMVKDLIATVHHNKAALGLFVTLTPASKPMLAEAAAAGFYESPLHGAFAKLQILTVQGLLNGTEKPRFPDLSAGGQTFKAAPLEDIGTGGGQGDLLGGF